MERTKEQMDSDMQDARMLAAQAWCHETTKDRVMDPALCEVFATMLCAKTNFAREFCNNMEYYRGLLDQCAEHLKPEVFVCDSGDISDSPLRAKIPELVAALKDKEEARDPAE